MAHIAAAEPHVDGALAASDVGIADHFRIPGLLSGEDLRQLVPDHAIMRSRETHAAAFVAVAARVEHPIPAVRLPDGGLTETLLIETTVLTKLKQRIGAKLLPADAIGRTGDTQALPARAVLAQVEEVEVSTGA